MFVSRREARPGSTVALGQSASPADRAYFGRAPLIGTAHSRLSAFFFDRGNDFRNLPKLDGGASGRCRRAAQRLVDTDQAELKV